MRRTLAVVLLLAAVGCGHSPTPDKTTVGTVAYEQIDNGLTIESPATGAIITTPVTVTGETSAWEVLVAVCDADGVELGRGFASIGNRPTAGPYRATVTFSAPTTTAGYITAIGKGEEGGPGGGCTVAQRVPVRFTALSFTG